MLKIYSNKNCPDCVACKKNLDYYQIPYGRANGQIQQYYSGAGRHDY